MPRADIRHGDSSNAPAQPRPTALTVLVVGNAVSMTGNVIMTVAVAWLVLTTTGSAAIAGIAVFAGVASATVGGLAAGRVVDAIGPVRASSVADLLSGLAVAPLPVLLTLDALEIWQVVLLTVFGTLADAAGSAARQGLVPGRPMPADIGVSARTPSSLPRSTWDTCSALRLPACSSPHTVSARRSG